MIPCRRARASLTWAPCVVVGVWSVLEDVGVVLVKVVLVKVLGGGEESRIPSRVTEPVVPLAF